MGNEVLLTKEGKIKLEERLEYLEKYARLEIAEKIKEARAFGDLSENAEYDAAKEEQAIIESEILEINKKLFNAIVIDEEQIDTKTVGLGCYVKVLDIEMDEKLEYKIVGTTEADLEHNKISNESPIGRSLIGKKKNDVVSVETPHGKLKFKILNIRV